MAGRRALVNASGAYERRLVPELLQERGLEVLEQGDAGTGRVDLQWAATRDVEWGRVLSGDGASSSYRVKTGLVRKADLARALRKHGRANPEAPAVRALPETHVVDLDDFDSDEALLVWLRNVLHDDARLWVLKVSGGRAAASRSCAPARATDDRKKGSESNRGENVHVLPGGETGCRDALHAMRRGAGDEAWLLQEYIADLMLLDGRKNHLRAHVLALGDLEVFVHQHCLVLPAVAAFTADRGLVGDRFVHLSNQSVQRHAPSGRPPENLLLTEACARWAEGEGPPGRGAEAILREVRAQVDAVVADAFAAVRRHAPLGFFPIANSFELFGVDFLLDRQLRLHLLEVISEPAMDLFQDRLRPLCRELLRDTLSLGLRAAEAGDGEEEEGEGDAEDAALVTPRFRRVLDEAPAGGLGPAEQRAKLARVLKRFGGLCRATYDGASGPRAPRCHVAAAADPDGTVAALLVQRGWEVTRRAKEALCAFAWARPEDLVWERVTGGDTVGKHYLFRKGLLGQPAARCELFMLSCRHALQAGFLPTFSVKVPLTPAMRSFLPSATCLRKEEHRHARWTLRDVRAPATCELLPSALVMECLARKARGTYVLQKHVENPFVAANQTCVVETQVLLLGNLSAFLWDDLHFRVGEHSPLYGETPADLAPSPAPACVTFADFQAEHAAGAGLDRAALLASVRTATAAVLAVARREPKLFLGMEHSFELFTFRFGLSGSGREPTAWYLESRPSELPLGARGAAADVRRRHERPLLEQALGLVCRHFRFEGAGAWAPPANFVAVPV